MYVCSSFLATAPSPETIVGWQVTELTRVTLLLARLLAKPRTRRLRGTCPMLFDNRRAGPAIVQNKIAPKPERSALDRALQIARSAA